MVRKNHDKLLGEVLRIDPLADAEKLTGQSYKDSEVTMKLGLGLSLKKRRQLDQLLTEAADTKFSEAVENYIRKIEEEGFICVLRLPFESNWASAEENRPTEIFYVYWKRDEALLLCFDTLRGRINGGKVYYNIKPYEEIDWQREFCGSISSGSFYEGVWCGDHDCREALRFNIARLRQHGTFLAKWVKQPFLWLLHFMDTKTEDYDYKRINRERLAMLPENVRSAIGV